jgi:hypothetical protein
VEIGRTGLENDDDERNQQAGFEREEVWDDDDEQGYGRDVEVSIVSSDQSRSYSDHSSG